MRFQFSIRTMLVMMVLVSVAMAAHRYLDQPRRYAFDTADTNAEGVRIWGVFEQNLWGKKPSFLFYTERLPPGIPVVSPKSIPYSIYSGGPTPYTPLIGR